MAATALIWDLVARDAASPAFNKVAASADRAAVATDRATASAEKAGAGFLGLSKKMAVAGGAFAIGDILVHSASAAIKFQKQMALIQTQAGASAREVRRMSSALLTLGPKVATNPQDLAKSLYLVESAGYRGAAALKIETAAAKEAKVGNADLTATTDALVGVMQTGIVGGANNAGKAVAALNAIVGSGKMTFDDLNGAMSTGLMASAKQFGVSLKSVGAALALMTDQGVPAQQAATRLRMTMSLLGAPTKQAAGILTTLGVSEANAGKQSSAMADLLKKAGVSTLTLATDLRKPDGFLVAMQDLEKHIKKAGLSAPEAASAISRAFGGGRSSGPILQMLANLDLLQKKFQTEGKMINSFGGDWHATTQTAAFALQKLGAEFDTAFIAVGQKFLPVITQAATWLGVNLPRAVSVLSSAFSTLGRVLSPIMPTLRSIGIAALAMWAAFKGYAIIRAVVAAITSGMETVYLKTLFARDAVVGWGTSFKAAALGATASSATIAGEADAAAASVVAAGDTAKVGWASIAGPIGLAVVGVGTFIGAMMHSSSAVKQNSAEIDSLTSAIEQDTGALGKNTRAQVVNTLSHNGALAAARMLGLNLSSVTTAAMKGGPALRGYVAQLREMVKANTYVVAKGPRGTVTALNEQGKAAQRLIGILTGENSSVRAAIRGYRDKKAAMGGDTSATKGSTGATAANTAATRAQTQALQTATTALFNFINAELSQRSAVLGFQAGLLGLKANIKQTGTSLDDSTVKGNANRQMLIGLFQSAAQAAAGAKDQAAAMIANVKALKEHAIAAGFDKTKIDAMIRSLKLTPKIIHSVISVDTTQANAAISYVKRQLQDLQNNSTIYIHTVNGRGQITQGRQAFADGGLFRGFGGPREDANLVRVSNREFIVNAKQTARNLPLLEAINRGAPGFASGGLVGLASRYHDWNPQIMAAIAQAESGGNERAHNLNYGTGDNSYGLWQINMLGSMGPARRREFGIKSNAALYNPNINVRAAHDIWRSSGYGAWSTYNSGAYQQYMGSDGSIHQGAGGGSHPTPQQRRARHRHHVHETLRQNAASYRSTQHPNRLIHAGGQWWVNGQSYGSKAVAEQALRQQRAQARQQNLNTLRSGLYGWTQSFGSVSSERSAFNALIPTLRQLGLGDKAIKRLEDQNKRLDKLIARRNAIQKKLDSAKAKLRADRQVERQNAKSITSSTEGFFDITSAGANANGVVSAGRMLAQEKQALTTITKWTHGIERLRKMGLSNQYLAQLAQAGPSSWPQVDALLKSPALFKAIQHTQSLINRESRKFGNWESGQLYNGRIARDMTNVQADENKLRIDNRDIAELAKHMGSEIGEQFLHMHPEIIASKDGKKLLLQWVKDAEKQERHAGVRRK